MADRSSITRTERASTFKRRNPLRLPDYDYSSPGAYFITPCVFGRRMIFQMPNACDAVQDAWDGLLQIFGGIQLDEFVVMPNHVHGIIWILEGGAHRLLSSRAEANERDCSGERLLAPVHADKPIVLGNIVGAFKTVAASAVNKLRQTVGSTVWQRNYYEHVIRSEPELKAIRKYIRNNPLKWELDLDNPVNWSRRPAPKMVDEYLRDAGVL